jgi:nicotinate phosphoribosyltransferase
MYHEALPEDVPRVCLVDTLCDEKSEAIAAAGALGPALQAVRLDTPSSRRGDMGAILDEVRWELDLRGHHDVKLFVSGSIDEDSIEALNPHADGYGVGTAISNADSINFALDIVEVDGEPRAKRGKKSGRKSVLHCPACGQRRVAPSGAETNCDCGQEMERLLVPLVRGGKVVRELPKPGEIREHVLTQLAGLSSKPVQLRARGG